MCRNSISSFCLFQKQFGEYWKCISKSLFWQFLGEQRNVTYIDYGHLTSDWGGRRTRVDKIRPAIPESFYVTIWSMLGSIFWKRLVSTNSRLGIEELSSRSVKFWSTQSVDPFFRSCNVNNVCDHNRIVIKYDHEWNRTWQMDYESG